MKWLVLMILSTMSAFSMDTFWYPLSCLSNATVNATVYMQDLSLKPVRYFEKYYDIETQKKILGLEPSPSDETKNKYAYEALRHFTKNMSSNMSSDLKFYLQPKIKECIYVALNRGPYAASFVYDMLHKNEKLSSYDMIRISNKLLSQHGQSSIESLRIVTNLGVIGQTNLSKELDNQKPVLKHILTKLDLILLLVNYIESLVSSIDVHKPLDEIDYEDLTKFVDRLKPYSYSKTEE